VKVRGPSSIGLFAKSHEEASGKNSARARAQPQLGAQQGQG
jgi:hypothetical protein